MAYQNHMRYHKGRKEFVCTYCSKAFMQRAHWQRHTATHTGERNHVCPVCQKAFIEPGDMRKHPRTHSKDATNFRTDSLASWDRAKEDKEREEKPPPDQTSAPDRRERQTGKPDLPTHPKPHRPSLRGSHRGPYGRSGLSTSIMTSKWKNPTVGKQGE